MKEEEQFQKCFIFFYYYNVNDFTGQRSHVSKSLLSINSYDKIKCGETVIAFFSRPLDYDEMVWDFDSVTSALYLEHRVILIPVILTSASILHPTSP